ncbi:MAG TPA: glucose 1-dehydrogenase [Blastocatellia bacterium]|nr:glucose 1-dehydrogenase [Blastocatellia bacterium]
MNNLSLNERVALVTGASSGIGRAAAIALAGLGASVAINYLRNAEGAEECRRAIEEKGGRATVVQADVSTGEGVRHLVETVRSELGPIDILVNNAGDLIERRSLRDYPEDLWDRVMNLNAKSALLCAQGVMPGMIERKRGVIINMGSIAGNNGGGPGAGVYAASKAAVRCLTKAMAKELAPYNIRVNCVAPGVIATPYHERFTSPEMMEGFVNSIPLKRSGTPEEIASVIAFLASDAASYVHGETIEINGGQLMD